MDWDTLHVGLRAWFAVVANVPIHSVAWEGEPVGSREYPQADLQLSLPTTDRGTDEVRREPDAQGRLVEYVVGNRTAVFTMTLRSRDQHGAVRAYVVLDRVRTKLESEFSQTAFDALEVALRDCGQVIRSSTAEVVEGRELSAASLAVTFAYTVSEVADLTPPTEPIEHVAIGGTVEPIGEVPDHLIP